MDQASPPPQPERCPKCGAFSVEIDQITKPAKAGFFVVKGPPGRPHRSWGLIGRARRLGTTLHDLTAYMLKVGRKERQLVLKATRSRVAEARLVRDELLAQGEREIASMLTAALKQFRLAGTS